MKMLMNLVKSNKVSLACALTVYLFSIAVGCFISPLIDIPKSTTVNMLRLDYSRLIAISFVKHNLLATLLLQFGFLSFGLFTFCLLFFNGLSFGLALVASFKSISFSKTFFLILPHGIFEIPSLILAGATGFKSLEVLLRHLRGGPFFTPTDIKEGFKLSLGSITLIAIAGVIEANITPLFLK